MSFNEIEFTTGPSSLPDSGTLLYNGCTFSPLFVSEVKGSAVKDAANRTIKYMEYTITVDGYVTMPEAEGTIVARMADLRKMLTAQGGVLIYQGRGMDIVVNAARGGFEVPAANDAFGARPNDVAWGPIPELLEFQPLGNGSAAKVVWSVKTCIPEGKTGAQATIGVGFANLKVLQFNYQTSVNYGEDGFSKLSISGTVEVAMTRSPTQDTRTLKATADDVRQIIDKIIKGIDLSRFRITNREMTLSRDKRTIDWSVTAEEKPYMDLPESCTLANGTYTIRPATSGMGLCNWLCTLRATYTLRADVGRRKAWDRFLALARWRIEFSAEGNIPKIKNGNQKGNEPKAPLGKTIGNPNSRKAWVMDFHVEEGLYLDSKRVTFSVTWRLVTTWDAIFTASGLWKKIAERNGNENLWEISMRDIEGASSWLKNTANPSTDIIVDFGSK